MRKRTVGKLRHDVRFITPIIVHHGPPMSYSACFSLSIYVEPLEQLIKRSY